MDFDISQKITRLSIVFVPLLLGIICHEVAHGWAAWKLGDPTAKNAGRLTLNPLPHLDQVGSLLFVLTALTSPFVLGWAKPVPIQPGYFKNPRKGMMIASFAGPLTNFILAFLFTLAYSLLLHALLRGGITPGRGVEFVVNACAAGAQINILLGWFNLIPLPPLDGSHILGGLLPPGTARTYYSISRYGILIILVLVATGLFWRILGPLVDSTARFMAGIAAVPGIF